MIHGRPLGGYPEVRPRRLRRDAPMRRLVAQTRLHPAELILPLFVREGLTSPRPISSMPGVVQHTEESLRKAVVHAASVGVGGVMLFGIPEHKDPTGSAAYDPDGVLSRAVRETVAEVGSDLVVMADLCLDEFTDHGHCGVLDAQGRVDNDATLQRYATMAGVLAEAGVHVLGPSGMMDGQIRAVRTALDAGGHVDVALLAYAAKYASAFYGPFREAVDSTLTGDRRTYQQDPANGDEALREVALDVAEGADMVMVKPAMAYLDLVYRVAATVDVPVAAYQISGEYSMIENGARAGLFDRQSAIIESLTCIRRAGASMILTYWADEVAQWL